MYDFTQDFTDYQKLVPNADLTVKPPSTGNTEPQGYDFTKDLESYRKIAPDMSGLESVNDPLIKKAQLAQDKQIEEDKKKLQLAADLMIESGYSPDPEGVASAQITEGARKSLAGMQDKILGKTGVITQRFGNRNPIEKFSGGVNYGTDIGVPRGTKVSVPPGKWKVIEAYAGAEEGKSAVNRGYGNSILVQNQETGEKMRFSHLSQVGVRPGEIVDGNKIVGATGSTGNSTGPHLDLEMYDRSGRLIDILNTPYSSYLGLGQGGGSGKGGGNPMMDKITQVGRDVIGAVGNTPILPFIPQITPNRMASYKAPLEDQTQNIPQAARNAFPITQIPEQIGSTVRQIGRFASLKPDAMDLATAPLMFMGGVKAKEIPTSALKKISTTDRQIMGDFVTAIENGEAKKVLGNLGKDAENIAKALGIPETSTNKTIAKHFNDIIEAMDKKGIKPLLDKEVPIIKPSTGGEIGGIKELVQEAKKYKSAEEFKNFMRGSATQYGEYNPKLRAKYGVTGEATRISELGVNPNLEVTIYRGVPDPTKHKIIDGDFVTTDKLSAESYAGRNNVVSMKVKAKDLIADYPSEFDAKNPFYTGSEFIYSDSKNKITKLTDDQLTKIYNQAHSSGEIGRIKILSTEPSIKTFYPNGFNNIDDIPDDILFSLRDGKKYIKKNGEILLNEVVPINKIKDTENLSAKAADNEYIKSNNITMPKNDSAILVDSNNNIIDGHHRYLLAKNANDKTIPVLKVPDESSSKIFEQYKKVIPKVNEELQSLKLQNNKFKYETGLDNPKLLKRISEIESSAGIPKRTK